MTMLSDYIRAQALWRESKAEEYPDDERNAHSAAALEALAAYVDKGADACDTWTITTLDLLLDEGTEPDGRVSRAVSRYGFSHGAPSHLHHAAFLDALVTDAYMDAYEVMIESEGASVYDDAFNPCEIDAAHRGVDLPEQYFERRGRLTEEEQEAWINAEATAQAETDF